MKKEDFKDFIDFRFQIAIKISRFHDFLQEIMKSSIPGVKRQWGASVDAVALKLRLWHLFAVRMHATSSLTFKCSLN